MSSFGLPGSEPKHTAYRNSPPSLPSLPDPSLHGSAKSPWGVKKQSAGTSLDRLRRSSPMRLARRPSEHSPPLRLKEALSRPLEEGECSPRRNSQGHPQTPTPSSMARAIKNRMSPRGTRIHPGTSFPPSYDGERTSGEESAPLQSKELHRMDTGLSPKTRRDRALHGASSKGRVRMIDNGYCYCFTEATSS